jgi:hypothetical protein
MESKMRSLNDARLRALVAAALGGRARRKANKKTRQNIALRYAQGSPK